MKYFIPILVLFFCSSVQAQTVATPTFGTAPNIYSSAQTTTISDVTAGAIICYTLSGVTPTAATAGTCDSVDGTFGLPEFTYSGAISITTSTQIVAIGTLSGSTNSAGAYAAYAINIPGVTDGPAVQPTLINTTFPNTTGYTVATVCASSCTYSTVTTAVAGASCKTILVLTAGQTFQQDLSYTKTCTAGNWIIMMSSDCNTSGICTHIGNQGTRVTPAVQPYMATLAGLNATNSPTINMGGTSGAGAAYLWLGPGIEITGAMDGTHANSGATIQDDFTAPPNIDHIFLDRVYVHCAAGQNCVRGKDFRGSYGAVTDSYFTDFHGGVATQSVAIGEIGGLGPFKWVNNYVGSAGSTLFAGGGGCVNGPVNPTDFEIRGNYVTYSFGSFTTNYQATPGNLRSLIELKEGQRVLVEGNYLDATPINGWNVANYGYGVLIRAAANVACHFLFQDGTVRYNYIYGGTQAMAAQGNGSAGFASYGFFNNIFHDNLGDNANATNGTAQFEIPYESTSSGTLNEVPTTANLVWNHNTAIASDSGRWWWTASCATQLTGLQITNNIGWNGVSGGLEQTFPSSVYGLAGVNNCTGSLYTWLKNVDITAGASSSFFPPTQSWPSQSNNFFPSTVAAVDFTNFNSGNGGNYLLTGASPYHNAGTDGLDVGVAHWNCLNSETAAALAGTWTESLACNAFGFTGGSIITGPVTLRGATVQ